MTVRGRSWRGSLPRAVGLAAIAALLPLPLWASGRPSSTLRPSVKASMERIVARDLAASPQPVAARVARQTQTPGSAPGFFKTRPGMVALAVMIGGAGYALYSTQHDRIHSPGKK